MSSAPTLPPTGPTSPALAAAVALIERGNTALTELLTPTTLADLPDVVVGDLAVRLAAAAEQTQAGAWAALARVADCGLPQAEGAASAGAWWCERIRGSKDEASTQVRLARRLSRHYAAGAWREGLIRIEHARVIAGGIDAVLARHARRIRRAHKAAGDPHDPVALTEELAGMRVTLEDVLLTAAKPSRDADGNEHPGAAPSSCAHCSRRRGSWPTPTAPPRSRWPANWTPDCGSRPSGTRRSPPTTGHSNSARSCGSS